MPGENKLPAFLFGTDFISLLDLVLDNMSDKGMTLINVTSFTI